MTDGAPAGETLASVRAAFHARLVESSTLLVDGRGVASNADKSQRLSRDVAGVLAERLGARVVDRRLDGQSSGKRFEECVGEFVEAGLRVVRGLVPADFVVEVVGGSRGAYRIADFEPFSHLRELAEAVQRDATLTSVLGNSYEISPDVLVTRGSLSDEQLTAAGILVGEEGDDVAQLASLRGFGWGDRLVHAVLSCKWTLRSDRAQNARSEALNILRNRKGRAPHIVVVTGEPVPSRLSSLALGTGDIDMMYHVALPELVEAVKGVSADASRQLDALIEGKRLRDIADLPLDLVL